MPTMTMKKKRMRKPTNMPTMTMKKKRMRKPTNTPTMTMPMKKKRMRKPTNTPTNLPFRCPSFSSPPDLLIRAGSY